MLQLKKQKKPKISKSKIQSWDPVWEKIFSSRTWGKYPPEELIRFTARNLYNVSNRKKISFLDIGCGTGACSWYLAKEGFMVNGIDGSKTAISLAKKRFKKERLKGTFSVMDMINLDFPANSFDVAIDVGCLQCNPMRIVPLILNEVNRVLKPHGKYFLMEMAVGTYNEPLKDKGYNHFYKLEEIKKLFKVFKILSIEKSERTENNRKNKIIWWVITCEKK